MTEIAEAYFHLKEVSLSQSQLKELGDLASAITAEAASKFFPSDSIIEVRLSEGSLKGWAKVIRIGALFGSYGIIADYKVFKESISEINNDARQFSQKFIDNFIDSSNLPGARVYRTERRTKTPGRIKRLIERREWLEAHREYLSKAILDKESTEIERLLQHILEDIDPSERAAVRKVLGENLPPALPFDHARIALPRARHDQLELLGAFEAEPEHLPDYLRRFRLSDAPKLPFSEPNANLSLRKPSPPPSE